MAYVYLLDICRFIDQRLTETRKSLDKIKITPAAKRFQEGRIEALSDFKDFLEQNFIPRLPRRIKKSYVDKSEY